MTGPVAKTEKTIPSLRDRTEEALVHFRLFAALPPPADADQNKFRTALSRTLQSMERGLEQKKLKDMLTHVPANADEPDAIDQLNELASIAGDGSFRHKMDNFLLDSISRLFTGLSPRTFETEGTDEAFYLVHARALVGIFETLIPDFVHVLSGKVCPDPLSRLRPSVMKLTCPDSVFLRLKTPAILLECSKLRTV